MNSVHYVEERCGRSYEKCLKHTYFICIYVGSLTNIKLEVQALNQLINCFFVILQVTSSICNNPWKFLIFLFISLLWHPRHTAFTKGELYWKSNHWHCILDFFQCVNIVSQQWKYENITLLCVFYKYLWIAKNGIDVTDTMSYSIINFDSFLY